MAKVVKAKIRLPVFSVAEPEAFQILLSLPLPQPATLVGALAYAVGVSNDKGTRAYEEVLGMVEDGELLAARAKIGDEGLGGLPLAPSSVVLKRFRIFDKGFERKKKGERPPVNILREEIAVGRYEAVKKVIEVILTDALYREYVMGMELTAVWTFARRGFDEEVFWRISRLGDTESLCTMVDVRSAEGVVTEKREVETSFPAPLLPEARVVNGEFVPVKVCDERRMLRPFVFPIRVAVERRGGLRYRVFRPTKVRLVYEDGVKVCETPWGDIVIG